MSREGSWPLYKFGTVPPVLELITLRILLRTAFRVRRVEIIGCDHVSRITDHRRIVSYVHNADICNMPIQ